METTVITGGSRGIGPGGGPFCPAEDRVVFLYEKDHEAARKVARPRERRAICCDVADGKRSGRPLRPSDTWTILFCAPEFAATAFLQDLARRTGTESLP